MEEAEQVISRKAVIQPGTIVSGKYEILSRIGGGTFGTVYIARHRQLDRLVALKVLHTSIHNEESHIRFEREAMAISSLNHKNIVRFYEYGLFQNSPFIAMELISGQSLETYLGLNKRMPITQAIALIKQVCEALACAHSNSVVHRDLKPSNIVLVEENGKTIAKIVDFGLAKMLPGFAKEIQQQLTEAGQTVGTLQYMSPEQCLGQDIDNRSDIYATGCILYECITGSPPFCSDNSVTIMYLHIKGNPLSLAERLAPMAVPTELQRTFDKATTKDLGLRYRRIEELHADLDAIEKWVATEPDLGGLPTEQPDNLAPSEYGSANNTNTNANHNADIEDAVAGLFPHLSSQARRTKDRNRWLATILAAIATLFIGLCVLAIKLANTVPVGAVIHSTDLYRKASTQISTLASDDKRGHQLSITLFESCLRANKVDHLLNATQLEFVYEHLANLYHDYGGDPRKSAEFAEQAMQLVDTDRLPLKEPFFITLNKLVFLADNNNLLRRRKIADEVEKFLDSNASGDKMYREACRLGVAETYLHAGDIEKCRAILNKIRRDSLDKLTQRNYVFCLSTCSLNEGDVAQSIQLAQQALQMTSQNDQLLLGNELDVLIVESIQTGNWTAAYSYFQQLSSPSMLEHIRALKSHLGVFNMLFFAHHRQWTEAAAAYDQYLPIAKSEVQDHFFNRTNIKLRIYADLLRKDGRKRAADRVLQDNEKLEVQSRGLQ